jgi:putative transposase
LACFGIPDPADIKVYCPTGKETFDDDETTKEAPYRGDRCEARDAEAMLNAGKDLAAVLQALEVSESTCDRWRAQYGGMKYEEAKKLKQLEDENKRLKTLVADLSLDNQMLKHLSEGNW